jgi:hypothetical protein
VVLNFSNLIEIEYIYMPWGGVIIPKPLFISGFCTTWKSNLKHALLDIELFGKKSVSALFPIGEVFTSISGADCLISRFRSLGPFENDWSHWNASSSSPQYLAPVS